MHISVRCPNQDIQYEEVEYPLADMGGPVTPEDICGTVEHLKHPLFSSKATVVSKNRRKHGAHMTTEMPFKVTMRTKPKPAASSFMGTRYNVFTYGALRYTGDAPW